ncbi:MAG: DUF4194 domain-containing protein [Clostridium sp.]|nr:DUF4194 domain-containing protein [Clostridium sp.]
MWEQEWEKMSDKDREQFARVVNLLFQKTFIVRDEVDVKSHGIVINKDFRFLERYQTLFSDYFRVAGWGIQLDGHRGVAALYNRFGYNHRRLDKAATYILFTLRLIYEEQLEKLALRREAFTTVGEVLEKMFHLGLLDKKPSDKMLRENLGILKNHSIIDKLDGSWTTPQTRLIIYPSVTLLVSNEKIGELYETLRQTSIGEEGREDEAAGEDAID